MTDNNKPIVAEYTNKLSLDRAEILSSNSVDANEQHIRKLCAIDFGTTHLSILYCDYVTDISLDIFSSCASVFAEDRTDAYFLFQLKKESSGNDDEDWNCSHVGAEAINQHAKILADSKQTKDQFCLFSNFKMEIYNIVKREVAEDECEIEPILGKKRRFKLKFILTKALKYLTDFSMKKMKKNDRNLCFSNVKWVLTLPAIWGKKGAQLMLICLKNEWPKVTDLEKNVECVLESEMGTIQAITENKNLVIPPNKNIAVFDIGGGTSDLHIFTYDSDKKQISGSASSYGGAFGGEKIDKEIIDLIGNILTPEEIDNNLMSLRNNWEKQKSTIEYDGEEDPIFFANFLEFTPSKNVNSNTITRLEKGVYVSRKSIYDIYQTWAKNNAKLVLETENVKIELVILVGGMLESDVFENMIKLELTNSGKFQENQIIVTKSPKLAIIRGAILHGLKRKPVIVSRISSHTYGFACRINMSTLEAERKEKLKLDQYKKKIIRKLSNKGEGDYLKDSICIFIKKGEPISLNWEKVQGFVPGAPNETTAVWRILESDEEYPMLESECRVIATFQQPHPEEFTKLEWKDQDYDIRFNFTNTINVSIKYDFETEFKSIPQLDFDIE